MICKTDIISIMISRRTQHLNAVCSFNTFIQHVLAILFGHNQAQTCVHNW